MTPEQEKLVLEILCGLDASSSKGDRHGNQIGCRFCRGEPSDSYGHYDGFEHREYCIVPKIEKLRETLK
jgi:hypothetical protein